MAWTAGATGTWASASVATAKPWKRSSPSLESPFLCADLGVTAEPRADHAAYLDIWLKVLKADKKAIFTAASTASQAVDFLANLQNPKVEAAA